MTLTAYYQLKNTKNAGLGTDESPNDFYQNH